MRVRDVEIRAHAAHVGSPKACALGRVASRPSPGCARRDAHAVETYLKCVCTDDLVRVMDERRTGHSVGYETRPAAMRRRSARVHFDERARASRLETACARRSMRPTSLTGARCVFQHTCRRSVSRVRPIRAHTSESARTERAPSRKVTSDALCSCICSTSASQVRYILLFTCDRLHAILFTVRVRRSVTTWTRI